MIILGIESSCDDTSVALLDITDKKIDILAEKTASQIDVHKKYGGVVPEIAGRKHAEKIIPLVEEVLHNQPRPDAIAVTAGPGLMTGLLVGVEVAKTLSYLQDIPLIRVNHIEGHIYSALLSQLDQPHAIQFPALALIVSGGHTELILMKDHGEYELIGKTRDDAAGEAFDKVAKLLQLPYPGGPKISTLAAQGDSTAISFPRPMKDADNFDFSFSGLKTAALYWIKEHSFAVMHVNPFRRLATGIFGHAKESPTIEDYCASFEDAIVDVLVSKTKRAVKKYQPKTLILAGGVSANKKLRLGLEAIEIERLLLPPLRYCMDNATMIALAGYFHARTGAYTPWEKMEANPSWKVYH